MFFTLFFPSGCLKERHVSHAGTPSDDGHSMVDRNWMAAASFWWHVVDGTIRSGDSWLRQQRIGAYAFVAVLLLSVDSATEPFFFFIWFNHDLYPLLFPEDIKEPKSKLRGHLFLLEIRTTPKKIQNSPHLIGFPYKNRDQKGFFFSLLMVIKTHIYHLFSFSSKTEPSPQRSTPILTTAQWCRSNDLLFLGNTYPVSNDYFSGIWGQQQQI